MLLISSDSCTFKGIYCTVCQNIHVKHCGLRRVNPNISVLTLMGCLSDTESLFVRGLCRISGVRVANRPTGKLDVRMFLLVFKEQR